MSLKLVRPVLLVLLISLPATGCRPAVVETPTPEPVSLKVVVVPYLAFAPLFIAQEEGLFSAQGLQVEFVQFDRSSMAIAPLALGDLDVLAGNISVGQFNAMARGSGIRYVADKGYEDAQGCGYSSILARTDLVESGALEDPRRWQELRVDTDPSGSGGYVLDGALRRFGLTCDDLQVADSARATLLDAFANGAIDVATGGEPWVTRVVKSGQAVRWVTYGQAVSGFQQGFITYGLNLLDKNPDAGRRFMVAYLQAVRQYNEGKTDRNLEILAQYTQLDIEFLREACWPSIRSDGMIDTASVSDFQRWAFDKGLLDSIVPVDQFWDPSFVESASE